MLASQLLLRPMILLFTFGAPEPNHRPDEMDSAAHKLHATIELGLEGMRSVAAHRRVDLFERRQILRRIVKEDVSMRLASIRRQGLLAKLSETRSVRNGLGPYAFAAEGPTSVANARAALTTAGFLQREGHAKTSLLLITARDNIDVLNRTVTPSVRAERDVIDRHLNTVRKRQITARNANKEGERKGTLHFAVRYPLVLSAGLANWSAFEAVFRICLQDDGCRQRLLLGICPYLFRVPMASLPLSHLVPGTTSGLHGALRVVLSKLKKGRHGNVAACGVDSVTVISDIFSWGHSKLDTHCEVSIGRCEHVTACVRGGFEFAHAGSKAGFLILMVS